jgi:hypothetical protein
MKARIALNTDAESIRVTNDRSVELTQSTQAHGNSWTTPVKPASELLTPESQLRLWQELDAVPSDSPRRNGLALQLIAVQASSERYAKAAVPAESSGRHPGFIALDVHRHAEAPTAVTAEEYFRAYLLPRYELIACHPFDGNLR